MSVSEPPEGSLVAGRCCGSCAMCCKVFRVKELDKAPMEWCRHIVHGRGCGIHATRPDVCRQFFCHYLRNPNLGPEWVPERCGFILYIEGGGRRLVVAVDRTKSLSWRQEPFYRQFKLWATKGVARDHQVLVFHGKRCTAVLPDRDQDLGIVAIGDIVTYHREKGVVRVEVQRAADAP